MTLPGNPENQPKAETREQLVRYWENSLDKLQEEDDAVVAGYILGDIVDTEFWEDEWMQSEEADPEIIEVHDLVAALEIPGGETIFSFEDDGPISREQAWDRVKEGIESLKKKYLPAEEQSGSQNG